MLNRRDLLRLMSVAPISAFARGDEFWNEKPPSEWTASEVYRMLSRSPWANPVHWSTPPAAGVPGGTDTLATNPGAYDAGVTFGHSAVSAGFRGCGYLGKCAAGSRCAPGRTSHGVCELLHHRRIRHSRRRPLGRVHPAFCQPAGQGQGEVDGGRDSGARVGAGQRDRRLRLSAVADADQFRNGGSGLRDGPRQMGYANQIQAEGYDL